MPVTVDLVALTLLPVWRLRFITEQLRAGRLPSDILSQHCADREDLDRGRLHLSVDGLRSRAEKAIARADRAGLGSIAWDDATYPALLSTTIDPPPVLWIRGERPNFDLPAVAVVGSRSASDYALTVADRLSADLAGSGILVVSGLARGVDSAAHRGALSVNGSTMAVLGCGVDVVYPREHEGLACQIAHTGAIVSEFVPGTRPHPRFFPQRNRIISGLARAVVVIEAGSKSGSLITARCALEQGRDVLAVPGNVLSERNRGGHALLRDGAALVESVDDILNEIGLAAAPVEPSGTASASKPAGAAVSSRRADPVLACLIPGESCDLDAIAERSGVPPSPLLTRLFELELRGAVRRTGGGRFVRV